MTMICAKYVSDQTTFTTLDLVTSRRILSFFTLAVTSSCFCVLKV